MKETILIIEDEADIARGLQHNLRFEGYETVIAKDGEQGVELALNHQPDLILLDVMMPKMNGFEALRELRRQKLDMPVIMLTAKGDENDIVRGLDLGADDYITKPFGLKELLARINTALRRKREFDKEIETICFGDVTIDFASRTVTKNDESIPFTTRELDLLHFFLSREGQALDRQEILNKVWGYDYFGTDRTVDNFINRLRQKLETNPLKPNHFVTVRGIGYRFQR